MSGAVPTSLRRVAHPTGGPDAIEIGWSDGVTAVHTPRQLRDACPCATCREKRAAPTAGPALLPVLAPEEVVPLAVSSMQPVGQYAYAIGFSDGHASGIYTLDYLRELAATQRSPGPP